MQMEVDKFVFKRPCALFKRVFVPGDEVFISTAPETTQNVRVPSFALYPKSTKKLLGHLNQKDAAHLKHAYLSEVKRFG